MAWSWEIAERDHEIQNATSPAKIRLLGEYLRLNRESRVLDIACGQAGPALVLASTFGCRIVGVEIRAAFAERARARIATTGLDALIEIHTADGAEFELEPRAWDAALCIGASFVWGNIRDAALALAPAVKPGGSVVVGEPFWREWPLRDGVERHDFVGLAETAERFQSSGLALTGLIAGSVDDFDHYESLHWRAVEDWLAANVSHPDAGSIRALHEARRAEHLAYRRELFGWAIFVGRKAVS